MMNEQKDVEEEPSIHQSIKVYPTRWKLVGSLCLCLIMLVILTTAGISIFQSPYKTGTVIISALLFGLCFIYMLGFIWSDLRLLADYRPSLESDEHNLTLRHLPFLGNVTLPWSEIESIHVYRYLLLSYLCIVPRHPPQLFKRYGFLRFALNTSSRFSLRTGSPLNISQNLLAEPINALRDTLRTNCNPS